jgi:hypothetical protein
MSSGAPDDWYCREVFCGYEDDQPPTPERAAQLRREQGLT